jgi:hypothetical protein
MSWARTADRAARVAPAVRARAEKFTEEARGLLGPDATDQQVAESAASLRKAHYIALSAKAHAAKKAKRAGKPKPGAEAA